MKKTLITGITGQDGAYLAKFLLSKGYEVHGIRRRSSVNNTERLSGLLTDNEIAQVKLHSSDLTESASIMRLLQKIEPDEIYNLGAQSHVKISFETPEFTANTNALGTLRILEALRLAGLSEKTKFYQASTSELFGKAMEVPQRETTPFYPRSPYAVAKLYGYWITVNYREAYGIYACNGILFNHESPYRGENFVTRKITRSAARIKHGLQDTLYLGNLDAKRDWGFAGDFVQAMWLMLQQPKAEDFVIGTGETHTVRDFVELAFKNAGITLAWKGSGVDEVGLDASTGKTLIQIDPKFFRPAEVDLLISDIAKAKRILGWTPSVSFADLVGTMVEYDLDQASRDLLCQSHGYKINDLLE